MIIEVGHFALVLALLVAIFQMVVPAWGARVRDERLMAVAEPAALCQLGLLIVASNLIVDHRLITVNLDFVLAAAGRQGARGGRPEFPAIHHGCLPVCSRRGETSSRWGSGGESLPSTRPEVRRVEAVCRASKPYGLLTLKRSPIVARPSLTASTTLGHSRSAHASQMHPPRLPSFRPSTRVTLLRSRNHEPFTGWASRRHGRYTHLVTGDAAGETSAKYRSSRR